MRTAFGAVAGALALVAMLVSYNLGERRAFSRDQTAPTTQMLMGPDGVVRPYLVHTGQNAYGQPFAGQPYSWSPYSTMTPGAVAPGAFVPGAVAPYAYNQYGQAYPVAARQQYVTERVVERPVARRTQRVASDETSTRSWQKSALLIGGSAGAGAGVGALMGGKKGALAGAAIGGGAAAIYDQVKRR